MPESTEIRAEPEPEPELEQAAGDFGSLLGSTAYTGDARAFLLRDLPADLLTCVIIGTILTLILTPFIGVGLKLWVNSLVFNTIISLCIGLSVANAFRFGLCRFRRLVKGRLADIAVYVVLAIAATSFGAEVAVRSIDALGGMEAADFRAGVFRIAFVVVAIILVAEFAYGRLRQKARGDELRAQQARKQALRAELKALQARTNPHFLYNSLNTVAGLIEENPSGAERVLEKLAGLFRYTLKGTEVSWVRLAEEIEAVENYLEVEAIRLGDRLRSDLEVAPTAREILVPPLILQPLVENAILHAIAPRKAGGHVRIEATVQDSVLELSVLDDGDGAGASPHRGSGTSLSELEERLELVYGEAAEFSAGPVRSGGFEVRMTLPIESGG